MARPRHEQPTPAELEVLKVLWDQGPRTVRQVMTILNQTRRRAYTSVMSLMNVMAEKGMLVREPRGRAYVYEARTTIETTRSRMLADLLGRVYGGSANAMVVHLLQQADPSADELEEIRRAVSAYAKSRRDK